MFISDNPIRKSGEDRLKRSNYSKQLGKALLRLNHEGSLVIGLCGAWGSGKSSILNLAIEEIQSTKGKKPVIFKFNPWNFSGQNKLISTFLIELGNIIGYVDNSKEAKRIGSELITYSKFFIPLAIPFVFTLSDSPFKVLGLFLINILYWTFEKIGIAVQKWGDLKEKTLEKFKESIDKKIKKLNRKIIVIIDDIDRLTDDEIRQVVQLVKQTADFASITYVLAFDDKQVATVLSKSSFNGREYLEKIVQVHFQVPLLAQDLLEEYFSKELNRVIKPFPQSLWDNIHWGNVYYDGIQNFIKSLRHVKRFINTLKFNISLVADEINPIDFICIEALRVFTPDVYKEIGLNEKLFTDTDSSYSRISATEQGIKKAQLEGIIKLGGIENKETITNIFRELFPQTESILGNTSYGHEWQEIWSKARRICAKNRFKYYFFLDIPSGEISQTTLNVLKTLSSKTNSIQKLFDEINKKGQIKKILDRMTDFKDEIPLGNISTFLLGLLNESDKFPTERRGMFDEDSALKVDRVVYHLLKRVDDVSQREKIIVDLLSKSTSLLAPIKLVSLEIPEDEKKDKEDKRLVRPEFRDELKKIALTKIESFAKSKKLNKVPDLAYILYRWKTWDSLDKPKKYINDLIETNLGLVRFIEGFMWQGSSQSMGDKVSVTKWKVNTKSMETFINNINLLRQRVEKLPKSFLKKLSKRHKLAVELFIESFNKENDIDD
jgi:predicted KAP-like P-loop ATPase